MKRKLEEMTDDAEAGPLSPNTVGTKVPAANPYDDLESDDSFKPLITKPLTAKRPLRKRPKLATTFLATVNAKRQYDSSPVVSETVGNKPDLARLLFGQETRSGQDAAKPKFGVEPLQSDVTSDELMADVTSDEFIARQDSPAPTPASPIKAPTPGPPRSSTPEAEETTVQHDLRSLAPGNWVNDSAMMHIASLFESDDLAIVDPLELEHFRNSKPLTEKVRHKYLPKMNRNLIAVIVNENRSHWRLVVYCQSDGCLELVDSMGPIPPVEENLNLYKHPTVELAVDFLSAVLGEELNTTLRTFALTPRQTNANDCGILVLESIRCLSMFGNPAGPPKRRNHTDPLPETPDSNALRAEMAALYASRRFQTAVPRGFAGVAGTLARVRAEHDLAVKHAAERAALTMPTESAEEAEEAPVHGFLLALKAAHVRAAVTADRLGRVHVQIQGIACEMAARKKEIRVLRCKAVELNSVYTALPASVVSTPAARGGARVGTPRSAVASAVDGAQRAAASAAKAVSEARRMSESAAEALFGEMMGSVEALEGLKRRLVIYGSVAVWLAAVFHAKMREVGRHQRIVKGMASRGRLISEITELDLGDDSDDDEENYSTPDVLGEATDLVAAPHQELGLGLTFTERPGPVSEAGVLEGSPEAGVSQSAVTESAATTIVSSPVQNDTVKTLGEEQATPPPAARSNSTPTTDTTEFVSPPSHTGDKHLEEQALLILAQT